MRKHPEQFDDEVLIANCNQNEIQMIVAWDKIRFGAVAYDVNNNPVDGLIPVFVTKEEIARKKLDYMLNPNFNIYGIKS